MPLWLNFQVVLSFLLLQLLNYYPKVSIFNEFTFQKSECIFNSLVLYNHYYDGTITADSGS